MARGLGLGLGLNKRGQAAFTTAMGGGTDAWNAYMASHPNITKRLGGIETGGGARATNLNAMYQQYGIKPQAAPGTPNPAPNTPGPAPAPTGAPGTTSDPNWYRNFISQFEVGVPSELNTVAATATADLSRLNPMATPSYEQQFGIYKDLMERELDKQTADLTEQYGSMGGRYSQDLTTAAGTMRRQGLQDLAASGLTALTNLNQQRIGELSGAMNFLQGVGVSKANIAQQGANTAWQDYLMTTSPPDMMNQMLQWSAAFSPPGEVVTQGK